LLVEIQCEDCPPLLVGSINGVIYKKYTPRGLLHHLTARGCVHAATVKLMFVIKSYHLLNKEVRHNKPTAHWILPSHKY